MPIKTTSAWRPNTKIGCYDPTQQNVPNLSDGPAAINVYGRAFNDTTRGWVMYEAGHNIGGTGTANIAAQREFFNYCFLVSVDKTPSCVLSNMPPVIINGNTQYNNLTATASSPVGLTQ